MARVLLVNPPIYDFAAFDLWAKPLGLLYVAAWLEMRGHEVRVVDCLDRFHPAACAAGGRHGAKKRKYGTGAYLWREIPSPSCYSQIPRIYKRFGLPEEVIRSEFSAGARPDVIGVTSAMTYWYPGVVEAVRIAREVFAGVPIVLGGTYATLCGAHARETVKPDYVVEGAGEAAMAEIVEQLTAGSPSGCDDPKSGDPAVKMQEKASAQCGRPVSGHAAETPLAQLPNPSYHLLRHVEAVAVITGRGCPYSCSYCASRLLAPRFERRPTEAVVDEICGYRERFGVRDVAFYDDALLWDAEKHIKPMLRQIIGRRLGMRFHTPNGLQARMVDAELGRLMKEAGFTTIRLALETAENARLSEWDNKVTYDDFLRAVVNLKAAGFTGDDIGAYVMTGIPGETAVEAARSIAAAHAAGVKVKPAHYSPIPGTAYFEKAKAAAGVDIDAPLMQNNTVVAAGGIGPYERYETLKRFTRRLNDELEAGRVLFTRGEVEGAFEKTLAEKGFRF